MVNPFKGSADAGAKKKSEEDGAAVGEDDGAGDDGAEGEEASKDKTRSYVKRSVYIFKTEDTARARRSLARGTATIPQVEMMTMVPRSALNLPERQGKHYNTSNKGTVLGPVALTRPETEWQATVKDKREIYGKRFRIAVGGRWTARSPSGAMTETSSRPSSLRFPCNSLRSFSTCTLSSL